MPAPHRNYSPTNPAGLKAFDALNLANGDEVWVDGRHYIGIAYVLEVLRAWPYHVAPAARWDLRKPLPQALFRRANTGHGRGGTLIVNGDDFAKGIISRPPNPTRSVLLPDGSPPDNPKPEPPKDNLPLWQKTAMETIHVRTLSQWLDFLLVCYDPKDTIQSLQRWIDRRIKRAVCLAITGLQWNNCYCHVHAIKGRQSTPLNPSVILRVAESDLLRITFHGSPPGAPFDQPASGTAKANWTLRLRLKVGCPETIEHLQINPSYFEDEKVNNRHPGYDQPQLPLRPREDHPKLPPPPPDHFTLHLDDSALSTVLDEDDVFKEEDTTGIVEPPVV